MTSEEIFNTNDNELIMLYHEENEDAKNILFYKYKFIIDILIKKYSKYLSSLNIDYQEIYSECTVGFSDGLRSFQEDKSASLATFITLCIERRLGNIIRKYNREKHKGLQETYSLDYVYEESDSRLMDFISDDYEHDPLKNITEQEGYNELIESIQDKLTVKEYEVFVLMVRGLSYLEIAKILDNTPKQIDNTIQRLKNKIRNLLNEKENAID
ncbi:MAG: sigma-70 family RNA polymerase sigma factor [Firmicutes bacterium]|nr:sigma-70 family RNA polymerase sigma factor [Bacillota bacterium]